MNNIKFAAGVTLYNPTEEELKQISLLENSFDKIILYDNSEPTYVKPQYIFSKKFELITENANNGLPYAFNKIIERCKEYDYLCTLDQDSTFNHSDIEKTKQFIECLKDPAGIVAPYIDYGIGQHVAIEEAERKPWVITSGSFVNLKVIRKEGLKYDDQYFIDKFEIDLCEQIRRKGYPIYMFHGATLHQSLGEDNGHRHSNHSITRHYYLFRNRLYFNNKWHSGLKRFYLNCLQTARHLLLIIIYEDNKLQKIKTLPIAFKHYKEGKMGKLVG